jgi:uncharacterized protein YbaP (TraB family)
MRTIFTIAALTLSSIFTTKTIAQNNPLENSLLWEVSGKGLTKPSYIYGTIHMICENDFRVPEKVTHAFDKTEKLIFEIDYNDPNEMADMQKAAVPGTLLSKTLNSNQYSLVDSVLKLKAKIPLKAMDQYSLFTVYSVAISKTLACPTTKSYEMEFTKLAKQKKIATGALETTKAQMEYLQKAYPDSVMVKHIVLFDDYKTMFTAAVKAYKEENITELAEKMNDKKFNDDETNKWMLEIRNVNWMKQMPEMMKKQASFFAVGAAHLPGNKGVLELLKAQGYTVKPIMN